MRKPRGQHGPSGRDEFLSMFFGRVVAREVVDLVESGAEPAVAVLEARPKEKPVKIRRAQEVSRHIVDLKPERKPAEPRPPLDLEQRLSVFAHALHRTLAECVEAEQRELVPTRPERTPSRASFSGFLKLPFLIAALPFRRPAGTRPHAGIKAAARTLPAAKAAPRVPVIPTQVGISARKDSGFRRNDAGITSKPEKRLVPLLTLPVFRPGRAWSRHLASFALIAAVVSLPLYALMSYAGLIGDAKAIAAMGGSAVSSLKDAGEEAARMDPAAAKSFRQAADSFAETRRRVEGLTVRAAALLGGEGEKLAGGTRLLIAGEALAKAGAEVSAAFDAFEDSPGASLPNRVRALNAALTAALPHLEDAHRQFSAVPARIVPERHRELFAALTADMGGLLDDIRRFTDSSDLLLRAIGADGKRRYLVVFQNSRELRPTGGFIGSFALIDVKDGRIERLEVPAGGAYDLRGGLNQRIAAPSQLRLVNTRWEFQDANWFADFPTSARALVWFYEKSGGPTVDGVVAVTSDLMQELLHVVGPIDMPEHGKIITAENFYEETQKAVEIEYDRALNRPKQIISDMAPKLFRKLLDGGVERVLPLAGAVGTSLVRKDIQVWFREQEEQAEASGLGWTGELKALPGADFLAVVDSNIAGGKTDGAIESSIDHEMAVGEDGAIVDTVTIRRTHTGEKAGAWSGIKNIDYLRVYAPAGSVLLEAEGFEAPAKGYFMEPDATLQPSTLLQAVQGDERVHGPSGTIVTEESGLAVFGNWIQLEPGETRSVKLRYRLPLRFQDLVRKPETRLAKFQEAVGAFAPTAGLKLTVHKQPGAAPRAFSSRIRLPDGWAVRSRIPPVELGNDGLSYSGRLDRDLYFGLILTHER